MKRYFQEFRSTVDRNAESILYKQRDTSFGFIMNHHTPTTGIQYAQVQRAGI